MSRREKKIIRALFVFMLIMCVPANGTAARKAAGQKTEKTVLLNRIDFGNSYIMGQSIKSGAVYLLQRKKSEINSMLKCRTDYRTEILEDFPAKGVEKKMETGSR